MKVGGEERKGKEKKGQQWAGELQTEKVKVLQSSVCERQTVSHILRTVEINYDHNPFGD